MNKPEWMLTVHDCRGETQEKINCSSYGEACEVIGNVAQRKLLEYLTNLGCYEELLPDKIGSMLKQLEV